MSKYKTEQEEFWATEFGNDYIGRNCNNQILASNLNFFSNALKSAGKIESCIEFGANIGMNLRAIRMLYPNIKMQGIEINKNAAIELENLLGSQNTFNESILNFETKNLFDLVLIKGVLIHLNPLVLEEVYKKLVDSTGKYLLISEYYNPIPVSISYRGYEDRLFKRDFCGEILDKFPKMQLIDYGFSYHRDEKFPQDDVTWFLLSKIND